jgi:hypothetical protein
MWVGSEPVQPVFSRVNMAKLEARLDGRLQITLGGGLPGFRATVRLTRFWGRLFNRKVKFITIAGFNIGVMSWKSFNPFILGTKSRGTTSSLVNMATVSIVGVKKPQLRGKLTFDNKPRTKVTKLGKLEGRGAIKLQPAKVKSMRPGNLVNWGETKQLVFVGLNTKIELTDPFVQLIPDQEVQGSVPFQSGKLQPLEFCQSNRI